MHLWRAPSACYAHLPGRRIHQPASGTGMTRDSPHLPIWRKGPGIPSLYQKGLQTEARHLQFCRFGGHRVFQPSFSASAFFSDLAVVLAFMPLPTLPFAAVFSFAFVFEFVFEFASALLSVF